MNFVAIDFETANSSKLSACSIGLARIEGGVLVEKDYFLIKPPEGTVFNPYNKSIHGISEKDVENKEEFDRIWPKIKHYFESGNIIAHNAPFDISVLRITLDHYEIEAPEFHYGCTVALSRKLWPALERHRLNNMAAYLGLEFKHHHAGEDARICAFIALKALQITHLNTLPELYKSLNLPFHPFKHIVEQINRTQKRPRPIKIKPQSKEFDPTHPFFHKNIVFTGILGSMNRRKAMQAVVNRGATVYNAVARGTHYLILGKFPKRRKKSSKLTKTEHLLAEGVVIHILREEQFIKLLNQD